MSKEALTLGEYLNDLRTRRSKLDALIADIEATLEGNARVPASAAGAPAQRRPRGPYSGLTIIDASMAVLRAAGKPMDTNAIANALRDGGLKTASKSPYRTIYNTLNNRQDKGDIKKSGAKWGLSEWEKE